VIAMVGACSGTAVPGADDVPLVDSPTGQPDGNGIDGGAEALTAETVNCDRVAVRREDNNTAAPPGIREIRTAYALIPMAKDATWIVELCDYVGTGATPDPCNAVDGCTASGDPHPDAIPGRCEVTRSGGTFLGDSLLIRCRVTSNFTPSGGGAMTSFTTGYNTVRLHR
jgi:hypothetical protein